MFFNTDTRGKLAFSSVAKEYDEARPVYPESIFRDAIAAMRKQGFPGRKPADVLEIGAGSGQATEQLQKRAVHLDVLEPGQAFAKTLRRRYGCCANTRIFETTFEDFEAARRYDLVASASALHWIPKKTFYGRIFKLLKPGGWFLGMWHLPLFSEAVYGVIRETISPRLPGFSIPRPSRDILKLFAEGYSEFSQKRGFVHCWQKTYSSERPLSAELCAALIWSYFNVDSLPKRGNAKMQTSLKSHLLGLPCEDLGVRDTFEVVMGQSPKASRLTKRCSGLARKTRRVGSSKVASR